MNIVESLKDALARVGAAPVMWLMIALSVLSAAVMLERAYFFRRIRVDIDALATALGERLRAFDMQGAHALLARSRSVEAAVAKVGLGEILRGPDAAREAMASAALLERARLERRLGFLGSLASNAPFIGLFGTVIGIILAFDELSAAGGGSAASAAVMASIAEALVTTAVGIGVAVPAVVAYNAFQQRIRRISDQCAALSHVVLAFMLGEVRAPGGDRAEPGALLHAAAAALARHTHEEA